MSLGVVPDWAQDVAYSDDDNDKIIIADNDFNVDYGSDEDVLPMNQTSAVNGISRDLSDLNFSFGNDSELNLMLDGLSNNLPPTMNHKMLFVSEISSNLENPWKIPIYTSLKLDTSDIPSDISEDDESAIGLKINHFQLTSRTHSHSNANTNESKTDDTNNKKESTILGEGGFAIVYRAIDSKTRKLVALKVMSKKTLGKQFLMKSTFDAENPECPMMNRGTALDAVKIEIQLMLKMQHSNILSLLGIIDDAKCDNIYLALPYSSYGQILQWNGKSDALNYTPNQRFLDLNNVLFVNRRENVFKPWWNAMKDWKGAKMDEYFNDIENGNGNKNKNIQISEKWPVLQTFSETLAKKLFMDCFKGIEYLHSNYIIHRDLKPANLLLFYVSDSEYGYCLKICDFGTAEQFSSNEAIVVDTQGTPHFWSPSACTGLNRNAFYDDIWALGCILHIFIFGTVIYHHSNEYQMFRMIENVDIQLPNNQNQPASDEVRQLIHSLLEKDDEQRITIKEIESHAWFNSVQ